MNGAPFNPGVGLRWALMVMPVGSERRCGMSSVPGMWYLSLRS